MTRSFFDGSLTVTVAPGTAAPLASLTLPTIEPVISCPNAVDPRQTLIAIASRIDINLCLLIFFVLFFFPRNEIQCIAIHKNCLSFWTFIQIFVIGSYGDVPREMVKSLKTKDICQSIKTGFV